MYRLFLPEPLFQQQFSLENLQFYKKSQTLRRTGDYWCSFDISLVSAQQEAEMTSYGVLSSHHIHG